MIPRLFVVGDARFFALRVEVVLQDDGGSHFVDAFFAPLGFDAKLLHHALGGDGGEPFVEHVHGDADFFAQFIGERLHQLRLWPDLAAEGERQADHEFVHVVIGDQCGDLSEGAGTWFGPDGGERRGERARGVAQRDANAPSANIERHNSAKVVECHGASVGVAVALKRISVTFRKKS